MECSKISLHHSSIKVLNTIPEEVVHFLEKRGRGIRNIQILPRSTHEVLKIQTANGESFFVKLLSSLGNEELLFAQEKGKSLYPLLFEEGLGLEPLFLGKKAQVFPYLPCISSNSLDVRKFGKALYDFHQIPGESFPLDLEKHALFYWKEINSTLAKTLTSKSHQGWQKILHDLREEMGRIFPIHDASLEKGFCHSDLSFSNLTMQNGKVMFLDVEYSGMTDIYWDFASVSQFLSEEDFIIFLQSYSHERRTDAKDFHFSLEKLKNYGHYLSLIQRLWGYWRDVEQEGEKKS